MQAEIDHPIDPAACDRDGQDPEEYTHKVQEFNEDNDPARWKQALTFIEQTKGRALWWVNRKRLQLENMQAVALPPDLIPVKSESNMTNLWAKNAGRQKQMQFLNRGMESEQGEALIPRTWSSTTKGRIG